jgi:hypothetical protein
VKAGLETVSEEERVLTPICTIYLHEHTNGGKFNTLEQPYDDKTKIIKFPESGEEIG